MRRANAVAWLVLPALLACDDAAPTEPQDFVVDGQLALASLMALSDGHLQQIEDHFGMLASTDEARSGDWERVRGPLSAVERLNVRALLWFALPDGSYWTVPGGVASRATGRSSAIVALPVRGTDGDIVGVLGSSVYLDSLSARIREEIDLQPDQIFFSIDATPIGALQDDPEQIFLHPYELDEPELEDAIREMLTRDEGAVNYRFRGRRRTVLYRRSDVSGWWYAFGRVWD